MKRRDVCLAAAGLAVSVLGACSLPKDVQRTQGFSSRGTPYGEALARYTRYAELYKGLDTVGKAWATWKSPSLRAALAEESIRAYRLQGEAAASMRREEERAARRVREFHVALYTPKKDWNDLESPDSFWKVRLLGPGVGELDPLQVVVVPKSDKSPVQYPYVSPWTREYAVFFPLLEPAAAEERLTLVLSGPLGQMVFAF